MDISKYGVRVLRKMPKGNNPGTKISKINPVDMEGTVLYVVMPSYSMIHAMKKGEWFKVFFTLAGDGYIKVRWDNDTRSIVTISSLSIRSFGTLPIYWPINAPSKEELAHRFDFRPAEELCPRTLPDLALYGEVYEVLESIKRIDPTLITSTRTARSSAKYQTFRAFYGGRTMPGKYMKEVINSSNSDFITTGSGTVDSRQLTDLETAAVYNYDGDGVF